MRFLSLFALIVVSSTFAGCGGPKVVPVKGSATYQGKPVPNLIIQFAPAKGRPSTATTDANGHFEAEVDRTLKGAVVGTHKISVVVAAKDPIEETRLAAGEPPLDPVRAAIFSRFGKADASPLTIQITKAEPNLELKFD